jgi:hypothetical protein
MSTPNLPSNTPKWINWAVKTALVAVPIFLAWVKPGNSFNSANVQAAIVITGIALASGIHVVEILIDNLKQYGLSKAALEHDVSDNIKWVDTNIGDLKSVYDSVQGLVGHVIANNSLVQGVTTEIKEIEAKIAAIPITDKDALEAFVEVEIKKYFAATTVATQALSPTTVVNTK